MLYEKRKLILITIKFIEENCIQHSYLHSIFVSLFVLIFLINNYYKNIVIFGTRDLFNISYSRELYLFSKFLHFEEIVRVKMAVCFEMIVSET